jgi:deoxyribodipyrimidine photo-lyase
MSNNQKNQTEDALLLWFRTDLRLRDHPAVTSAVSEARMSGLMIIPIYVHDDGLTTRPHGAASRWWLRQSLRALSKDLEGLGSRLIFKAGKAAEVLADMVQNHAIRAVYAGHSYDPATISKDVSLTQKLAQKGVNFRLFNATHFIEPNSLKTKTGTDYKVFTPFFRALDISGAFEERNHLVDENLTSLPSPVNWPESETLETLGLGNSLTPSGADWATGFAIHQPGEAGALQALDRFLHEGLSGYADDRDRPDLDITSKLSAHLRFGEISPQRVISALNARVNDDSRLLNQAAKFKSELAWREFSYGLLMQVPDLHVRNFRPEFNGFPWTSESSDLQKWTGRQTGYELVDAGMSELWATGFMHNRVRMVVASFLTKHLLIDWRCGESWFWDTLVDADPANNPASWQWVAGCGADAAPYFRVFNPLSQAEKFDPKGFYRARHLKGGPVAADDLFAALTTRRPALMITHEFARARALLSYEQWRKSL